MPLILSKIYRLHENHQREGRAFLIAFLTVVNEVPLKRVGQTEGISTVENAFSKSVYYFT